MLTFILAAVLISLQISSHLILEGALRISTIIIHILQKRHGGLVILHNPLKIFTAAKRKPTLYFQCSNGSICDLFTDSLHFTAISGSVLVSSPLSQWLGQVSLLSGTLAGSWLNLICSPYIWNKPSRTWKYQSSLLIS